MIGATAMGIVREFLVNSTLEQPNAREFMEFCEEDRVPADERIPALILAFGPHRQLVTPDEARLVGMGRRITWAADMVEAARTIESE